MKISIFAVVSFVNKLKYLYMKKFYALLIACVFVCGQSLAANNETKSNEALQAKVDSLELRLAKMEKRAATWQKIKQHFKISGFLQAGYYLDVTEGKTDNSYFRLRRARLSLAGKIVENEKVGKADYRLQVDFAESPKIVDLWIRYQPFNQLGLQVGQFKIPLSIENSEYSPTKLEFIDYSLVVQRLVRMSSNDVTGISSTGRDCGAQLFGGFIKKEGFNMINYNLAVFNGCGINQKKDNNSSKDFVGRVMVNPIKDLTIAGYYQYGEGNFNSETYSTFFNHDANGNPIGNSKFVKYQRYGGGIAYNGKHAFARAEYIRGNTGILVSEGAYASAGWKFHTAKAGHGSLGARFDYFDNDVFNAQREFNYTLGATYQPWKYLRLQLNYTIKHYQHFSAPKPITNSLSLMVTGMF